MKNLNSTIVCLSFVVFGAAGCQYATQSVILKPTVTVSQLGVEQRREVNLKVVDDRTEQNLGHRSGGFGQGAEIKLGNDLVAVVRDAVTSGLAKLNVGVATPAAPGPVDLTVTVRALKYVGSSGMFTFGSNVEAVLQVAGKSGDKTFEKRYTLAPEEKRSAVVTTADFNERLLNEGLTNLLNQFLNDPGFLAFVR